MCVFGIKTLETDLASQVGAERTHSTDAISSLEAKLSRACDNLRTDLANASTSQAKTIDDLVGEVESIRQLAMETGIKAEDAVSSSQNAMDAKFTVKWDELRRPV